MWLPIIFDPNTSFGVMYVCFGCGEKINLPMVNEPHFKKFINENVSRNGCKKCNCKDYVFKDFKGRIYAVDHIIEK